MKSNDLAIELIDVYKSFKIYKDKGSTLKDRLVTRGRSKYSRHQVLQGINLSIKKGEVIGLIGENGCGKSTALKLISQIMYPDKGSVSVQGRVSSLIELGAGFHPDLSGRENIYTNAAIFGLSKKEIDKRINDIIDFSELWDFIDNPVRTYSSGMYTRLAFSVAINVDADILLIDEILAVGDKNFQKKCFDWLKELKKNGTTIVIVTHDTSSVESLCTRAVWINEGVIADDGLPERVVNSYYEYMYDKQLALEKRLQEERNKAELLKKDFSRNDIIELYRKYLQRDPDGEETFNHYFKYFDKKKDIEHYLKYSTERMAIVMRDKQKATEVKGITKQDVIDIYQKYLHRDPDNDTIIENCCNVFKNIEELANIIVASPEYKYILLMAQESENKVSSNSPIKSISIDNVYFTDKEGEKAKNIISGEKYELVLKYSSINKRDFGFAAEIYAGNGILCYSDDTLKANIGRLPDKGTISLMFPSFPLIQGKYKLFVFTIDKKREMLDDERRRIEFEVVFSSKQKVGNEWRLKES